MESALPSLGVFRAIKLCEMAAKVRRNQEEIVLVRKESAQFLDYMGAKKDEVKAKLLLLGQSLLSFDPATDHHCSLVHSVEISTYTIDERDANSNKLYLRGVHAVLSRSLEYYTRLIAKGQKWFSPIAFADAASLNVVHEAVDAEAFLEDADGGEIDDTVLVSAAE